MSVSRGLLVSLQLCLLGAAVALAQPVGPEFRVNTYTTNAQRNPKVALDSAGNFVVVWESRDQDGSDGGIFAQRYASTGTPLGKEFRVSTYTSLSQIFPSVATDPAGNFVVVWQSCCQDGSHWGVFGQRFHSTGAPLGGEFRVNTYTTDSQHYPSVASDSGGNFVVAWLSSDFGNDSKDVHAQRYASTGEPLGGEFRVSTHTIGLQHFPSVASDSAGNFVVVWEGLYSSSVLGQRYASTGEPLGGEFQVNTYIPDGFCTPAVASDSAGNFVVAWRSQRPDSSGNDVVGQRYDSDGNRLGGEFVVSSSKGDPSVFSPSVASDSAGNFVIAWQSYRREDGLTDPILAQRYDSTGAPLGEFRVNTYTLEQEPFEGYPSVASDPAGNFVVVWASKAQDGSDSGVFGQRFSAACEASVQVKGDVHTPGSTLPIRIHIAHNRPETVTVPWELTLVDPWGRVVAERVTPPHTFEPGDVVNVELAIPLPEGLEGGTYTLRLGIGGMAGTEGATTSFRVVGPSARTF